MTTVDPGEQSDATARPAGADWQGTGPSRARRWHWLVLVVCVIAQAGLFVGYLIAAVFLTRSEAWLDVPARLTVAFMAASVVVTFGLIVLRPWARLVAMLTPVQLVWPVLLAASDEPLGTAIIVGAAGSNAVLLLLIGPLFVPVRLGWWDLAAAGLCLAAFGTAFIDPGPHPPAEHLEPVGIGTWRGPNAAGEATLPDGQRVPVDDIRMIPAESRVVILDPGDPVIYGRDRAGKTWVVALGSDEGSSECLRLRGPAFRTDGGLLVSPSVNQRNPSDAGILLSIAPVNPTEAEELARPRLIGSYCLDDAGRVRSHDPPMTFGY